MSQLKFAVGDKAYIEVEVKDINNDPDHTPYYIKSIHGARWISEDRLLSPSDIVPQNNTFNVEVGDVIEDIAGDTYKVSSVNGDCFFLEKENDVYIHKTEVKAVYKKVWSKEKTLEEMSREELIARIKELEQGE